MLRQSSQQARPSRVVPNPLQLAVLGLGVLGCTPRTVTTVVTPAAPRPPVVRDGRSLLQAMQFRYNGRWFRTLSFLQNNTLYSSTGRETKSQWREYLAAPGRLRIDYLPVGSRSGLLYTGGRVHVFQEGRQTDVRPSINVLLLLSADIYLRSPDSSARLLDSLGFRTAALRTDTWQGRRVYIVGAAAGDTTTSQFWVDSARMVVVRLIQKEPRGNRDVVTDYQLSGHVDVGGWPIASQVLQRRDGRLIFREEHEDLRIDDPLSDELFDPARWSSSPPR